MKTNPPDDYAPLASGAVAIAKDMISKLTSPEVHPPTDVDVGVDGQIVLIQDNRKGKHLEASLNKDKQIWASSPIGSPSLLNGAEQLKELVISLFPLV